VLKKRIERRYLLTRFDSRRKMSWAIDRQMRERFGADVCETRIAESVSLAESPFHNRSVFGHAPESRGAQDYTRLLDELQACDFLQ
jgi:chromosome partitioning protein